MKDCRIIRVLNKRGDELLFNLDHPNPALEEYSEYIKVSQEFFEWAFLSQEQMQQKETQKMTQTTAIESEIERIQRTMMLINADATTLPKYTSPPVAERRQ